MRVTTCRFFVKIIYILIVRRTHFVLLGQRFIQLEKETRYQERRNDTKYK